MPRLSPRRVASRWLSAAPLEDYITLPRTNKRNETSSLVGENREYDPQFMGFATKLFEARRDRWAIIVTDESEPSRIREFIRTRPNLAKAKIMVVTAYSYPGDFTNPDIVLFHDIVGHSIVEEMGSPKSGLKWVRLKTGVTPEHLMHLGLSKQSQVSQRMDDARADIYAALFFYEKPQAILNGAMSAAQRLKPELSLEDSEGLRDILKAHLEEMQNSVAQWTSGFKRGSPTFVKPW